MDFEEIKEFVRRKNYLFSEHADEERTKDKLTVKKIEQAVLSGEVIEERVDDPRGESRLIAGKTKDDKLLHIVIGTRFGRPVVVTVYIPSEELWSRGRIRRRQ